ncbi:hypothetical protein [Brachyspira alvinipulli]|uniref:hypothetical protein n=1 Tax=Brachyspira alvinipulli TaxID=84379 RepID=UPI0004B4E58F|nr:hypothetical protein [Brachyspira alvinipulli]
MKKIISNIKSIIIILIVLHIADIFILGNTLNIPKRGKQIFNKISEYDTKYFIDSIKNIKYYINNNFDKYKYKWENISSGKAFIGSDGKGKYTFDDKGVLHFSSVKNTDAFMKANFKLVYLADTNKAVFESEFPEFNIKYNGKILYPIEIKNNKIYFYESINKNEYLLAIDNIDWKNHFDLANRIKK